MQVLCIHLLTLPLWTGIKGFLPKRKSCCEVLQWESPRSRIYCWVFNVSTCTKRIAILSSSSWACWRLKKEAGIGLSCSELWSPKVVALVKGCREFMRVVACKPNLRKIWGRFSRTLSTHADFISSFRLFLRMRRPPVDEPELCRSCQTSSRGKREERSRFRYSRRIHSPGLIGDT